MVSQLENRVNQFIQKKDEEVDRWLLKEAESWMRAVGVDEQGQKKIIAEEELRYSVHCIRLILSKP